MTQARTETSNCDSEIITVANSQQDAETILTSDLGTCTITLTAYNEDGEIVDQVTFDVPAYSEMHCAEIAGAFRRYLNR